MEIVLHYTNINYNFKYIFTLPSNFYILSFVRKLK
jgi:hypothetical protein